MPIINLFTFTGVKPKLAPRALPNEAATIAKDCQFPTGNLEPYKLPKSTNEPLDFKIRTIFRYKDKWWFKWFDDVDAVKSPIINDPWDRVYFTSKHGPQVTNNIIFNGAGNLPVASYPLGVNPPGRGDAPQARVNLPNPKPKTDDKEDDETRFYVFTYVTEQGEESPPSPLSNQAEIKFPTSTVTVTFPPIGKLPGNIKSRRLYRTATGGGTGDFFEVGTYPLNQMTVTDHKTELELGEPLPSEAYEPPNKKMRFLTALPNGIIAGGYDNNVCFCEPYLPHAFPPGYQLTTEHEIVAMESVNNTLFVGTKGFPEIFQGVASDAMSGRKLNSMQACVSKRSMRNIDDLIIYASPHGLCAFTGGDVTLITENIISSEQWKALKPETIEAYYYDGKYLAFYGTSLDQAFTYEPKTGELIFYTTGSDVGYTDLNTGLLYVRSTNGKTMATWNTGNDKDYIWRSKEYYALFPTFSTLYVRAKNLNKVGIRVIVDGKVIHDYKPGTLDTKPVRIPPKRGNTWQFEAYGSGILEQVCLATSMAEII